MKLRKTTAPMAAMTLAALLAAPGWTQDLSRADAASRISYASAQGALATEIAKAVCLSEQGVDSAATPAELEALRDAYRARHVGLAEGNAELGLVPMRNEEQLALWAEVDKEWQALDAHLESIKGVQGLERMDFDRVLRFGARVRVANRALVDAIREHETRTAQSIPALDGIALDLYARQVMLADEMLEDACLIVRGDRGDGAKFELRASLAAFEEHQASFLRGKPLAGIPAPPTADILAKLEEANAAWERMRPTANNVANSGAMTGDELVAFKADATAFSAAMRAASDMLRDHAVQTGG